MSYPPKTSFLLDALDVDDFAIPYEGNTPGSFTPNGHVGFPTFPDGSLRTSVPHLARFLAMMAGSGMYRGTRVLSATSVREMFRLQVPDLDDSQGLIWYHDDFGARSDIIGHNGGDPGTSSVMFFDPRDNAGVLIVANGDWYEDDDSPAADALLERLFEESSSY